MRVVCEHFFETALQSGIQKTLFAARRAHVRSFDIISFVINLINNNNDNHNAGINLRWISLLIFADDKRDVRGI